jgi:hypothetical protein
MVLSRYVGKSSSIWTTILQLTSATLILTATLAVLAWEIQSYVGQTLPEKVNRWLYRTLYVVGTYLFIVSLAWI